MSGFSCSVSSRNLRVKDNYTQGSTNELALTPWFNYSGELHVLDLRGYNSGWQTLRRDLIEIRTCRWTFRMIRGYFTWYFCQSFLINWRTHSALSIWIISKVTRQIIFCKILKMKLIGGKYCSSILHLNGRTLGFHLQTFKKVRTSLCSTINSTTGKFLLSRLYLNGQTLGFHQQTQKLEAPVQ